MSVSPHATSVSKVHTITRDLISTDVFSLSPFELAEHGAAFRPLRRELLLATVGHPLPLSDQRARVPYSPSVGD